MPSFRAGLLQLFIVIALALLLPAGILRLVKPEPGEAFPVGERLDPKGELKRLNKVKPDWIIVGNSMANSRVDWRVLSELSGRKVLRVAEGGTQSAIWFLFLKQIIAKTTTKPEWVSIFFRDTDLTWPDFRTTGVNDDLILALRGPSQPEWKQVLVRKQQGGTVASVGRSLAALLPADEALKKSRRELQEAAFMLTPIPRSWPDTLRRQELNERFSLSRLRHDLGSDSQSAATPGSRGSRPGLADLPDPGMYENGPQAFDSSPDASFLPHMIALAKQHGIKLHFHRVKRRPLANHTRPDPALLTAYLADLKQYLETNGAVLTDESQDASLSLDLYADGDHIASDAATQRRYAENFWARVRPVITIP